MTDFQKKYLPGVLIVMGIAFIGLKAMTMMFPDSWMWEPRQPEYEQMILGVYAVLGVFLLIASRNPEAHLSLIWFTAISNLVHGFIMLFQALADPADADNLVGDVPALIALGVLLVIVTPRRLTASTGGADGR